ncbi:MAG: hypothetical protein COB49_07460 [Alphaproteobacteria bacterium]|nr:MAG: hypothetical protein COB49_07460 [Alphaproteobacteria bacterium]
MKKIIFVLMGELPFALRLLLEFPRSSRRSPLASYNMPSKAAIWAAFWMAGAAMIGLFGGIGWHVIAPMIAGWLS